LIREPRPPDCGINEPMRASLLLTLLVACGSSSPNAKLDGVKQEIRDEFPDVRPVTTEQLAEWLADPDRKAPVLLDVRETEEYGVSHLRSAQRALTESEALEALRGVKKDDPVVVYCSVGYRSAQLARALKARGYTHVVNLEGSIFQWANEGRPVYHDGRPVNKVHPYDATWGKLLDPALR